MPKPRDPNATRAERANPGDRGQRFEPTPGNEYGVGGGSSLEATMEQLRARESMQAQRDEPLDYDPAADIADDLAENPEPDEGRPFPRRTADGSQPIGAADDDQRMG